MATPEYRMVPIGKLRKNPFNPRKTFETEDKSLRDLAASIKAVGILEPLIGRKLNGEVQVGMGERRRMGGELAGLREVPVIVRDLTDEQMRRYALIENIHRLDLQDDERVEAVGKIFEDEYKGEDNADTRRKMEQSLGLSSSDLSDILKVYLEDNPDLRAHGMSLHARAALSALNEEQPEAAQELAEAVAEGELSAEDVRQAIPVVRAAARRGNAGAVVRRVKRAGKKKKRAREDVHREIEEARHDQERPRAVQQRWERVLNQDERLLNRVAKIIDLGEKLDVTYLNLFTTPDARKRAVQVLRKTRDIIDATLAKAERLTETWQAEWKEDQKKLKGKGR